MALLEERYEPGLSTKAALALALDCCRALQQQQQGQDGGAAVGQGSSQGDGEGQEPEAAAAALDVALISREGVRLVERLSPPEALLDLVPLVPDDEEGGYQEREGQR